MLAPTGKWKRKSMPRKEGKCPLCGRTHLLTNHHIFWIAEGGTNAPCNMIYICRHCHSILTHELDDIDFRMTLFSLCVTYNCWKYGLIYVLYISRYILTQQGNIAARKYLYDSLKKLSRRDLDLHIKIESLLEYNEIKEET